MDAPVGKKMNPDYASYMTKSFGATLEDLTFNRLPTVILRAKEAIPGDEIVGFLICALYRPPRMTGLIFCDQRHSFPPGLPMHTPPVVSQFTERAISWLRRIPEDYLWLHINILRTALWARSFECNKA